MRNLKTKGFTLVELIVVIAIIGVLAAVLVPAMLGYMRDSKISQANQNAHAVYTAAQAAVTKYATANGTANTKNGTFESDTLAKGDAIDLDITITGEGGDAEIKDFGSYLGDQFVGAFAFEIGPSGDTINYALYAADAAYFANDEFMPIGDAADAEQAQIEGYKEGNLIGVHPQYPAGESTGE